MSTFLRAINAAERIRNRRYYAISRLFRNYTMIPDSTYVSNLKLVLSASSVHGAIVECGTWKGGMIAGMAKLLGKNREYYLYDSFEGLPATEAIDGQAAKRWQENTESPGYFNNCTASEKEAATAMSLAGITDAKLVKGGGLKTPFPGHNLQTGLPFCAWMGIGISLRIQFSIHYFLM